MSKQMNDGIFEFTLEDDDRTAVLYYSCPECGSRTRFTASDEQDGRVSCSCGQVIRVEGDSLVDVQGKLDEVHGIPDRILKAFEKIGS